MSGIYALGNHTHIVDGSTWWGAPDWISPPMLTQSGNWKSLAVGDYAVYAVRDDGTLWAWGIGKLIGVGLPSTDNGLVTITQIGSGTDWVSVGASSTGGFALKENGELWAWGDDYSIGLGNNSVYFTAPTLVPGQWRYLAANNDDVLAIATNGTLWAWGHNSDGVHGRGDYDAHWTPTLSNSSSWSKVSVCRDWAAGIKEDGSLWSWGEGPQAIGDGSSGIGAEPNGQVFSPVHIGVGQTWIDVACGWGHKLAIRSDGTLWSWGYNSYGELGHGGVNNADIPTQVGTDSDWVFVNAGYYASFGIKVDKTLWAWGDAAKTGISETYFDVTVPTLIGAPPVMYASVGFGSNGTVMVLGAVDQPALFWTNHILTNEVI